MKIIFDLDYTLLDTMRFNSALAGIFFQKDFLSDYKKYFKDRGINFNAEEYLIILKSEGKIDDQKEKTIKLSLEKFIGQVDNYLFKEATNIVRRLREDGAELILLTFGNKRWQEIKVSGLSIKKYFKQIIFEDTDKHQSEYLKLLRNIQEEILIVNDNARETRNMVEVIGARAKVFLVDGPSANNIKHDWPIRKLSELIYDYK
jgi:FMN phosphatase YigB (HAD superfamily)